MQPKHFTALEEKDCLIQSDGEKSYKLRRLEVGKEGAEPRSWVRATPPLGGWDGGGHHPGRVCTGQNGEITWGAHFLSAPISPLSKSREEGIDQRKMEESLAPSPGKSSLTWPGAQGGRSRG